MDENTPGTGGSSPLEVERQTLAKVRNWLGEVSDQIERDRQEAQRRMFRSVMLVLFIGSLVGATAAYLVSKRTIRDLSGQLQTTTEKLDGDIAGLHNLHNIQIGNVDALRTELRNELAVQNSTNSSVSTTLSRLTASLENLQAEIRKLERRITKAEDDLGKLSARANQTENQTPVPHPNAPAPKDGPQPPSNEKPNRFTK